MVRSFVCGPLAVRVRADDHVGTRVARMLELFDVPWDDPLRPVEFDVDRVANPCPPAAGHYLTCQRMLADTTADGLRASTTMGATAEGVVGPDGDRWTIAVPEAAAATGDLDDIEELITLALTTGWRRAGWLPVHAATVVAPSGRCALICAPSGGGKSTLTAALISRGCRALGDDKVLLRIGSDGVPEVAALLHTFNLHPDTRRWLPEVGDLTRFAPYSAWTDKRRARVATLWPDGVAARAHPTDLVQLDRAGDVTGVEASPLAAGTVLPTLLRQTVVPNDPTDAAAILTTIARAASHLRGTRLRVGTDAYHDGGVIDEIVRVLS